MRGEHATRLLEVRAHVGEAFHLPCKRLARRRERIARGYQFGFGGGRRILLQPQAMREQVAQGILHLRFGRERRTRRQLLGRRQRRRGESRDLAQARTAFEQFPFECVGEVEESLVALSMLTDDAPVLVALRAAVPPSAWAEASREAVLTPGGETHVPEAYGKILDAAIA